MPHRLTNLRERAQIVVARHLLVITPVFVSLHLPHLELSACVVGPFHRFHPAMDTRNGYQKL
jgi:hypothetical protein